MGVIEGKRPGVCVDVVSNVTQENNAFQRNSRIRRLGKKKKGSDPLVPPGDNPGRNIHG
jgi:hypothetical protein